MLGKETPLRHSRTTLFASRTSGRSELQLHMSSATVLVSIDPLLHGAVTTATVLLETLRRMPPSLVLDPTGLDATTIDTIVAAVTPIDPERGVDVGTRAPPGAIRVHIGPQSMIPCLRALPEGHGGHVISDPSITVEIQRRASGLGCVTTAAMAATEIFKELVQISDARCRRTAHTAFCPVTLSADLYAAPELPDDITFDLGILGIGAVGTAVARLLSLLPMGGRVLLVDNQNFGVENVGTYSLGTTADAISGVAKTALAAEVLVGWDVVRADAPVQDLVRRIDAGEFFWPRLVISSFDNVEARFEAQRLWSDVLIDTGTGDTMVGIHELGPAGPCVRCVYPDRRYSGSPLGDLALITELDPEYLAHGDALLELQDVMALSPGKVELLLPHVGKKRCSLIHALGLTDLFADDFLPAAPFVAQLAASLAVGRLISLLTGVGSDAMQVQYDVLVGPDRIHLDGLKPRPDCYCQTSNELIARVRDARRSV